MSTLSQIGSITRIQLLNLKKQYSVQPVRFLRKIDKSIAKLTVQYPIEPLVRAPVGASDYVYNRNPRNLERLALAYRNEGWALEKRGKTFYHRFVLNSKKLRTDFIIIGCSQ